MFSEDMSTRKPNILKAIKIQKQWLKDARKAGDKETEMLIAEAIKRNTKTLATL